LKKIIKNKFMENFQNKVNKERLLLKRNLPDLEDARKKMVEDLQKRGSFDDKVIAALLAIPRHAFAPPHLWRMAYSDVELWGPTAFLPRPIVVAKIAQTIIERSAGKILEYATGTGYLTTIVSLLVDHIDTVEHDPWQLWSSSDAFRELEIKNISQKASDGKLGWPERSPFDAIILSASVPKILQSFTSQIKENGIMIAPVGSYYGPHRLTLWIKNGSNSVSDLGACYFQPLTGVWQPQEVFDTNQPHSFWKANNQDKNAFEYFNYFSDQIEGESDLLNKSIEG
jgi:protein-L-isoaspartate(D-aspartate) O-methyltransferase